MEMYIYLVVRYRESHIGSCWPASLSVFIRFSLTLYIVFAHTVSSSLFHAAILPWGKLYFLMSLLQSLIFGFLSCFLVLVSSFTRSSLSDVSISFNILSNVIKSPFSLLSSIAVNLQPFSITVFFYVYRHFNCRISKESR